MKKLIITYILILLPSILVAIKPVHILELKDAFKYVTKKYKPAQEFSFKQPARYERLMKDINLKVHGRLCKNGQKIKIDGSCYLSYSLSENVYTGGDYQVGAYCGNVLKGFLNEEVENYNHQQFIFKFYAPGSTVQKKIYSKEKDLNLIDSTKELNMDGQKRWVLQGTIETGLTDEYKNLTSLGFVAEYGVFCNAKIIDLKRVQNPFWISENSEQNSAELPEDSQDITVQNDQTFNGKGGLDGSYICKIAGTNYETRKVFKPDGTFTTNSMYSNEENGQYTHAKNEHTIQVGNVISKYQIISESQKNNKFTLKRYSNEEIEICYEQE